MSDRQCEGEEPVSHQRWSDQRMIDMIRTLLYGNKCIQMILIYADCHDIDYFTIERTVDQDTSSCFL